VALLVVAAVSIWAGLRRGEVPFDEPQLEVIARDLEGRVHEAMTAVHARALTLAEIPRLGLVVYTDAQTAQDLTREELSFAPHDSETVEVRQLSVDKPAQLLLRVPVAAPAVNVPDQPGVYVRAGPRGLGVSEVLPIGDQKRPHRDGELGGALVVSRDVDLRLTVPHAECCAAWIDVGDTALPLGARPRAAGVPSLRRPIGLFGGTPLALELQLPPQTTAWAWLILAAAALLEALWLLAQSTLPRPVSADTEPQLSSASLSIVASYDSQESGEGSAATQPGGTELTVDRPKEARRVGRYSIVRKIASGGIADVFLARTHGPASFQKQFALKVLKPELARQKVIVDHFVAEARLASQLAHPNIVEISDLGIGNDYFIVMELIDGADLRRLLESARARHQLVPLPIALAVLRAICDGLHAAHTALCDDGQLMQIVHRDVKPGNILIGRNGAVKVSDFGIAHVEDSLRVYVTEIGEVKGTTAYMAPEQRLGQAIDLRVDVYGVGALAYQLLTNARINLDIVRMGELGEVGWPHLPPLDALRPELPPELSRIVLRALSYRPQDRFPSCDALERELAEVALHVGQATSKMIGAWVAQRLDDGPLPAEEVTSMPVLPETPHERAG
jgi:serine/threonine-protein kinase